MGICCTVLLKLSAHHASENNHTVIFDRDDHIITIINFVYIENISSYLVFIRS